MTPEQTQQYLYEHIPISKAMGIEVCEAGLTKVVLSAPLQPNINHRETVFGGSASAVAILSAWTLLHLRLSEEDITCRLVIHRNSMSYIKPITGLFHGICEFNDEVAWKRFTTILKRRKLARITVNSVLEFANEIAGNLEGEFVAMSGR